MAERSKLYIAEPKWGRADYDRAMRGAITPDVVTMAARMLAEYVARGEPWAIREVLDRCCGRPGSAEPQIALGQVLNITIVKDGAPPRRVELLNGNEHPPHSPE